MQIPKEKFSDLLSSGEYLIIDVRKEEEQAKYGVISEKQLHIDISQGNATQRILALDTNKKYLLYCWHGVRSHRVNIFMRQNGFSEVFDLEGGIDIWFKKSISQVCL